MLRSFTLLGAAALMFAGVSVSLAEDATTTATPPPAAATGAAAATVTAAPPGTAPMATPPTTPMTIAKGQTMIIMADGSVVHGQPSEADAATMMKDMKPMKGCIVFMMGADGQMYQYHRGMKKCKAIPQT